VKKLGRPKNGLPRTLTSVRSRPSSVSTRPREWRGSRERARRHEPFAVPGRNNPHKPRLSSSLSPKKANRYKNLKASGVLSRVIPVPESIEPAIEQSDDPGNRNCAGKPANSRPAPQACGGPCQQQVRGAPKNHGDVAGVGAVAPSGIATVVPVAPAPGGAGAIARNALGAANPQTRNEPARTSARVEIATRKRTNLGLIRESQDLARTPVTEHPGDCDCERRRTPGTSASTPRRPRPCPARPERENG
jgi:hypothetical protein